MSQNSVSLVRVFCFQDGYDLSDSPIQSSPGVWDENGLRRIDLILSQAAQYGIYVIVVPTNFEPVGGGMQWYVDQVSFCIFTCIDQGVPQMAVPLLLLRDALAVTCDSMLPRPYLSIWGHRK